MQRDISGEFNFSVVVATYERPSMTIDLIQSLRKSVKDFRTRKDIELEFECLVCCSRKDVQTIKALEDEDWRELEVITTDRRAASHNRDVGFQNVTGTYVAVVDSDCIVANDWVRSVHDALLENDLPDALQGAYFYDYPEKRNWYTLVEANEDYSRFKDRQADSRNIIFYRETYSDIGGYDTDHLYADAGEDLVLRKRLEDAGHTLCFTQEVKVYHRYPTDLLGNLQRYNRYGRGAVHIKKYYPVMYEKFSPRSFISSTLDVVRSFITDRSVSAQKVLFRNLKTCSFVIGFIQGSIVYRLEGRRSTNDQVDNNW